MNIYHNNNKNYRFVSCYTYTDVASNILIVGIECRLSPTFLNRGINEEWKNSKKCLLNKISLLI